MNAVWTKDQPSDEELVQRIREGDTGWFQALASKYAAKIYGMALRMMRNPADAEDALQDIFLVAFRKLDSFRGEAAFSTWLYKVALNAIYMKLRERKAAAEEDLDENLPQFDRRGMMSGMAHSFPGDPENNAIKAQATQALREAIEALPPDYRVVLVARDIEELSSEETAQALGLSIAAVKSRLHRARLFIRGRLEANFI